jgi:predicted alpha/beta-hydrolase family hydrolase
MSKIVVDGVGTVSALWSKPREAVACFVFAHGAGAGMTHPFMETVATGVVERNIATLRYQFPYMERRSRRPDGPPVAHATVRAAVVEAARVLPRVPIIAGGKSFGGRMSSQAQAAAPLVGVRGLIFFGFPLHPAGKPSEARAEHLWNVHVPMLFLQGARDALADLSLVRRVAQGLGNRASLHVVEHADHSSTCRSVRARRSRRSCRKYSISPLHG